MYVFHNSPHFHVVLSTEHYNAEMFPVCWYRSVCLLFRLTIIIVLRSLSLDNDFFRSMSASFPQILYTVFQKTSALPGPPIGSRVNNNEPRLHSEKTETAEPVHPKPRIDNVGPRWRPSGAVSDGPDLHCTEADTAERMHPKPRNDDADPRWSMSRTDRDETSLPCEMTGMTASTCEKLRISDAGPR